MSIFKSPEIGIRVLHFDYWWSSKIWLWIRLVSQTLFTSLNIRNEFSFLSEVSARCRIQPFPDRQRQHRLRPGPGNGATVKKERRRSSSAKRSWSFGRKWRRRRSRHRRSSLEHVEPDGQSKSGNIRSSEGARKVHSLHRHCCSQVSVRACYRLFETFFGFVQ